MADKLNLNIRPEAYEIYELFTNLNYTEWYALAEFIDNSTASFYLHEEQLLNRVIDNLTIQINFDKKTNTLTIEDDAFGMELSDFKRAILIGKRPEFTGGRNEFGRGLKTAATWFGRRWEIESTEYESQNKYSAYIDLDELSERKLNDINIVKEDCSYDEHYTKITIKKLNRQLNTKKIKDKIIEVFNGMYRRDLKSGKIQIIFNGTTLSFKDYPILNYQDKEWKRDISFSFENEGRIYTAKGFVGIMDPGGFNKTGFALFRRNRVVIANYKPKEIFVQPQNPISLKLFGEVDMDSFDVNQAKDGFSWGPDLEEKFILNLKLAISDYLPIAKLSTGELHAKSKDEKKLTPPKPLKNDEKTDKIINNIPSETNNVVVDDKSAEIKNINEMNNENKLNDINSNISTGEEPVKEKTIEKEIINLEFENSNYTIEWKSLAKTNLYNENENNVIVINKNNKFIQNINEESKVDVSKMILAFCLATKKAKQVTNEEGYISIFAITHFWNDILAKIKEK